MLQRLSRAKHGLKMRAKLLTALMAAPRLLDYVACGGPLPESNAPRFARKSAASCRIHPFPFDAWVSQG
ncbi:hypothetical protein GCM10022419_074350 [Nonomuraea rosea]|uniref:Uncharacterized protein n=1 Tax=Nonomuraea rosea TaxID=638574 RepID=A0ABP6YG14_9ACTN